MQHAPSSNETFLTISAVAHRAGVCTRTVRAWSDSGRLPHIRTEGRCGSRLFKSSDVDALIKQREQDHQQTNAA